MKSGIRNPESEIRTDSLECASRYGPSDCRRTTAGKNGSVLIIVLWIAFGLVSLALYFANAMNLELRASDNRVSAQAADQAIEGAARYINYILATQAANGSNGVPARPCRLPMRGCACGRRSLLAAGPRHQ